MGFFGGGGGEKFFFFFPLGVPPPPQLQLHTTIMRHLTTGVLSEKCAVRRFRRCANVIQCTYTNLDRIAYYTPN